jgi:hypothetical protein
VHNTIGKSIFWNHHFLSSFTLKKKVRIFALRRDLFFLNANCGPENVPC